MSFGSPLANQIVRKRVEETMQVSSVPEVHEARLLQVYAMTSATSQMTLEQLQQFYLQHHKLLP
jgi:alpha/beta superfamily hydrolase